MAGRLGVGEPGSSSTQRGCAYGQRAANLQPVGGFTRSGGRPLIASRRVWLGWVSFGIDLSNASVYGWRVVLNSARVGAFSTIAARVHHRDVVGAAGDDAEVVRDEHHRHEPLALLRVAADRGSAPAR